ncbi:MAG: thiazole synthase [Lentisphaerae bacterium]|nr:MAG: thiazole synthase [Lentisphaerota bacterium]
MTSGSAQNDFLEIGGKRLSSRLFLGSALYPNPEVMCESIKASGAEVVTCSLRRQNPHTRGGQRFWEILKGLNLHLLPNTAGCKTVKEAVTTAQMAREVFGTNWIKVEVIGDDYTLQPDTVQLVEAVRILVDEGFEVFPYTTEDLVIAERLVEAGARIVMPWAAPIGSGRGICNRFALETLRNRLGPEIKLVVDAGIGSPKDAVEALEMGYDAVLVNSAVALAKDATGMATAFKHAVIAGRLGYLSGRMEARDLASPSTPTLGTPFWHIAPED